MIEPAFTYLPPVVAATTAHTQHLRCRRVRARQRPHHSASWRRKRSRLERPSVWRCWSSNRQIFMKVFWPFIRVLNGSGQAVVRLIGLHSKGGHAMVHSEEELKMLVTASQEAGVLEENEEQMLHRVFGFADLTAGQIMTPRTEIVAADRRRATSSSSTSSRGPLAARLPHELDDVIGFLRDGSRMLATLRSLSTWRLASEAPATSPDVLAEMRRRACAADRHRRAWGTAASSRSSRWWSDRRRHRRQFGGVA
jgi:hypothetical protein